MMAAALDRRAASTARDGFALERDGVARIGRPEADTRGAPCFIGVPRVAERRHASPSARRVRLDSGLSETERVRAAEQIAGKFVEVQPRDSLLVRVSFTRPSCATTPILTDVRAMLDAFDDVAGAWLIEDHRRAPGGAHVYGVVLVPDGERARALRHWWLGHTGADGRWNRWRPVSGGREFALGVPHMLVRNLAKVVRYATKPLPSGTPRDLAGGVVASGRLSGPWGDWMRDGRGESLLVAGGVCAHCGAALAPGRHGQTRVYCASGRTGTSKCRSAAHRCRHRDAAASTRKPSHAAPRERDRGPAPQGW